MFLEQFGPAVGQRDLPRRRGCLCILETGATALRQTEPPRAQRNRPGGDDRDLLARAAWATRAANRSLSPKRISSVATESFSLMTGTTPRVRSRPSVEAALR